MLRHANNKSNIRINNNLLPVDFYASRILSVGFYAPRILTMVSPVHLLGSLIVDNAKTSVRERQQNSHELKIHMIKIKPNRSGGKV